MEKVDALDKLTTERDNKRQELTNLRTKRQTEFMAGFSIITLKLKEMYQMITLGGDAELELVDSLDPFSEGVVFRFVSKTQVLGPRFGYFQISSTCGSRTLNSRT